MRLRLERNDDPFSEPFKNLQLPYEVEFAPLTESHLKADGTLDTKEIMSHWAKKEDGSNDVHIYILYSDQAGREPEPIGFTVVNLQSMVGTPDARDIAEFYVVNKARNTEFHAGTWMAHEVFRKYPGTWEVRQLPTLPEKTKNFWVRAIRDFPERIGEFENVTNPCGADGHLTWEGSLQRFFLPEPTATLRLGK